MLSCSSLAKTTGLESQGQTKLPGRTGHVQGLALRCWTAAWCLLQVHEPPSSACLCSQVPNKLRPPSMGYQVTSKHSSPLSVCYASLAAQGADTHLLLLPCLASLLLPTCPMLTGTHAHKIQDPAPAPRKAPCRQDTARRAQHERSASHRRRTQHGHARHAMGCTDRRAQRQKPAPACLLAYMRD